MTQFAFLESEWPTVYEAADKAAAAVYSDPRTACFYARRALEMAVFWLYQHDAALQLPYQDNLSALIHDPTFRNTVGPAQHAKVRVIKDLGNLAVHSRKPIQEFDAMTAVRELFHFSFWLVRSYGSGAKPADSLTFDADLLPKASKVPPQTVEQLTMLASQLADKDAKLTEVLSDKAALDAELAQLRAEVARIKKANAARPDTHDYSEEQTRDYFIDLLLKEAGWTIDKERDTEVQVQGMPNNKGVGFVDYVLWGDDGKPLAVVEAKRTKRDARVGQQQASLYADCLETQYGQRPIIFYSNGYDHWMWDDANYPPRAVQGFLKKDELDLLVQRRTTRQPLGSGEIDAGIVGRYYQTRAIRRIAEAFEKDHDRRSLVVMATGAGKTRTVIALCDLMMRCHWAKRVLFLADRTALVNQAVNNFKKFLPASSPVNLVTEKDTEGRVYVSTYQTMIRLIDESRDDERKFGVGHFDLVIIDEAHRSVYQKYGAIFDYFDSLLVGLTATPKDEVDKNTYKLFGLETGVPTDVYGLEEAVADGYLVPTRAVSVPLKFQREGIRYDDLSEDEQEQWDALEWPDDGPAPDRVEAAAVNKWLFNIDTVDKVLEHLMTRGQTVAGGDRLGKTIVFAKNHEHAEFIALRFNANYPQYKGFFARVIDFKTEYAQNLIDLFSQAEKTPHIAISVDMLDTGIDVPEVVNLVFFKIVRSKTKFWQMIGRGTRLSPDLFGPGLDKAFFYVFDYCQNLEYFNQNPDAVDGSTGASLGKQLFKTRLELIFELDKRHASAGNDEPDSQEASLRQETATRLMEEVAAMSSDNFIVRPKRRLVEKYAKPESWQTLKLEQHMELAGDVAGLPSQLVDDDQEAKRFDLLMLRLQLAVLCSEPSFARLRDQVIAIAGILEEKSSIPMVQEQMPLILDLQTEDFWQDVTAPILETVRKRLRLLVKLIEKGQRLPVFTDFEDELGLETDMALPNFGGIDDFERFRSKARKFLRAHLDHLAIYKLRWNKPLTRTDLDDLERMLMEAGIGTAEDLTRAKAESHGLGMFVRSLIGMDQQAAKDAFGTFIGGSTLTANQIEFINKIVDHLTQLGSMDAALLYESPFTDFSPLGVDGLFSASEVSNLIGVLDDLRSRTAA